MNVHLGTPRNWLGETPQLDLSHPKIHITAIKLTQSVHGPRDRAVAIHDFVRRIPFGAFSDVSHVRASDVLRANHGDCHSKGVLFVALCRAAQVPARLNFNRIRPRFLHGILDDGPATMAHALGQVLVEDRWLSTDGYVVDPVLFAHAKYRLRAEGVACGWGLIEGAQGTWNGQADCIHQFEGEDLVHNYGAYDDPAEFYAELSQDEGAPTWIARLKYAMGTQILNRRVARLREERPLGNQVRPA
ncbi:MAG: transglutaminase-like domain-containing protein [Ramlibacter sp.]